MAESKKKLFKWMKRFAENFFSSQCFKIFKNVILFKMNYILTFIKISYTGKSVLDGLVKKMTNYQCALDFVLLPRYRNRNKDQSCFS